MPETAPFGETQGSVPATQICPTAAFPLGTPLTLQLTPVSGEFVTVAANVARSETPSVVSEGTTLTLTLLVIVTLADAVAVPPVAWTLTGFVDGRSPGAVYTAVWAPPLSSATIVPRLAFPPATPFTSHAKPVPLATHSDAVSVCVPPSATLGLAGEIRFAHVIVTLALPLFAVSASLVAVMVTFGGEGAAAGAV